MYGTIVVITLLIFLNAGYRWQRIVIITLFCNTTVMAGVIEQASGFSSSLSKGRAG